MRTRARVFPFYLGREGSSDGYKMQAMLKPENLLVRCMAHREGDLWVAVCLDYSLAAQASSLREARSKLHAQIVDYVSNAFTVDAERAEELLTRRAPLLDRLRYRALKLRARMRPALRWLAYNEPLPLQPNA